MTFSGMGAFRNLARCDPTSISTGFGSQTFFHAVDGITPLVFLSTVKVGGCYLLAPKEQKNGKWQKQIHGAGIEGEWERLLGVIGHVLNKDEFKAQIQDGLLSFCMSFTDAGVFIFFMDHIGLIFQPPIFLFNYLSLLLSC